MSSAKVERAIALVSRIEAARTELAQLESEFEELVSRPTQARRPRRKATEKVVETNGNKPSRNRLKVLKILKRSNEPMKLEAVQKKLGISDSGTFAILKSLVDDGQVVKPKYAHYASA
jgi:hypothetical protein